MLFYVSPLKYLATALTGPVVGLATIPSLSDGRLVMLTSRGRDGHLRRAPAALPARVVAPGTLGLDAAERIALRFSVRAHLISTSLAVASIVLALVLPANAMIMPEHVVRADGSPSHVERIQDAPDARARGAAADQSNA